MSGFWYDFVNEVEDKDVDEDEVNEVEDEGWDEEDDFEEMMR